MAKPRVFVTPSGALQDRLFLPRVRAELESFADPTYNQKEERLTCEELAALLPGYQGLLTGWGAPQLTSAVLDAASDLRMVAHAAGTIKFLLPDPPTDFFRRGLKMSTSTPMMARYVAEHALCLAIACLRRVSSFREEMKGTDLWWGEHSGPEPDTIIEKRVGMVGLGLITWELVRMLKPFECEVWAYSKHADLARAEAEGIKLVELDDLMRSCPIIFIMAAVRPDTIKMINRERLRLIPDDGVLVNTARGAIIDEEALVEELKTGRFYAGIDVTEPEPPAADSPLRTLPNVLLTPHVGGPVPSRRWDMALFAVQELDRFFRGEPLQGEVTERRLEGMA